MHRCSVQTHSQRILVLVPPSLRAAAAASRSSPAARMLSSNSRERLPFLSQNWDDKDTMVVRCRASPIHLYTSRDAEDILQGARYLDLPFKLKQIQDEPLKKELRGTTSSHTLSLSSIQFILVSVSSVLSMHQLFSSHARKGQGPRLPQNTHLSASRWCTKFISDMNPIFLAVYPYSDIKVLCTRTCGRYSSMQSWTKLSFRYVELRGGPRESLYKNNELGQGRDAHFLSQHKPRQRRP